MKNSQSGFVSEFQKQLLLRGKNIFSCRALMFLSCVNARVLACVRAACMVSRPRHGCADRLCGMAPDSYP